MRNILRIFVCVFFLGLTSRADASNVQSNAYLAVGTPGNALLTNSAVQVVSGQKNLLGLTFYNPNGSVEYIQIFDSLSTNVTLGTTVPKIVLPLPASTTATLPVGQVTFFTGIAVAATTTAIGTSAPGTGITANIVYQ